jgi:acetyl-CoA C-acetyltransferase
MKNLYIFDSIRTARTSPTVEGGLSRFKPLDIMRPLINYLLSSKTLSKNSVDDLIIGSCTQIELQGSHFAAALRHVSGLSPRCQSTMLSNGRASAFSSLQAAMAKVGSNQANLCLVGSLQSSSHQAQVLENNLLLEDPSLYQQINYIPLSLAADCLSTLKGYSRRDLDQYAFDSHQKANQSFVSGKAKQSLIILRNSFGQAVASYDELVKENITMEDLAKNSPFYELPNSQSPLRAYREFEDLNKLIHLHHKGNSTRNVDAASLTLLGSQEAIKEHGLVPRARIRSIAMETSTANDKQHFPFSALQNATNKALQHSNLTIEDVELFEVDESYAAFALNYIDHFNLDLQKVNVNGGSLATGEARGTTAHFMMTSLIDELERRKKRIGLLTHLDEYNQAYCLVIEITSEAL